MKNHVLLMAALAFSFVSHAQSDADAKSEDRPQKRYETIRIIDGDTISHDIRIMKVYGNNAEMEMSRQQMRDLPPPPRGEFSGETEKRIETIEVYIHANDRQKEHILRRLQMHSKDFDAIMADLEEDEDLIVDMGNDNRAFKIIKIEIDEEKGEELETIEVVEREIRQEEMVKQREHAQVHQKDRDGGLKIFPNPTEHELNLEFEVLEGKICEVSVMDLNGTKVFEKTYNKAGTIKEHITLKENQKGKFIVRLWDPNRTISKQIIIE